MLTNKKQHTIPKVQPVKFVEKGNGVIKGYAVNTFHGMVKDYNEDRVSIIMNITKPNYKGRWPKCSYFGVFDGHGGDACSNFLKDNMHKYITQNQYFPLDPIQALKAGFKKAELQFIRIAESQSPPEKSGSCALVVLIIDQICYVANVGDSRAILSSERGTKVFPLSYDHKPDSQSEKTRIQKANGKIYQSIIKSKNGSTIPGPFRILPGKLSVSRSFGDIEAKLEKYGGNSRVLIAKPEITYFQINNQIHDFMVLGSDGIFDKLTNEEIIDCFWDRHANRKNGSGNDYIGEASSKILMESMGKMSMDNVTSLIIVFEDHGKLDLPRKKMNRFVQESNQDKRIEKQNSYRQILNGIKSERELSSKLVQKLTMRRKSASHYQSDDKQKQTNDKTTQKQKQKQESNSRVHTKQLRKDNTMKILPTHYQYQNQNMNTHNQMNSSNRSQIKMQKNDYREFREFKEVKDGKQDRDREIKGNNGSMLTKILKSKNVDKIR